MSAVHRAAVLAGTVALAACAGSQPEAGFAAALPPPPPAHVAPPAEPNGGSIYQASLGYAGLYEGTRARRVGDPLTILLVETLSTSKTASGATSRSGSLAITPPTAGPLDFLDPNALKAAASGSFKGQGNAAQSSSLRGAVAVTIAEVRPNGTARVVGEKVMSLSQGREWVQFSGIVRFADIDVENTIPSSRVADARINYLGSGAIQQSSRPGWLSRFFTAVSPF